MAQRYMPSLINLAKSDPASKPALLVTSSLLPQQPIPFLFNLSLAKAAQRNLMQSLNQTYAPEGVHVGMIVVGGQVSPDAETLNPSNIAEKTWEWYNNTKDFEVEIL
jgi:NAD(P)-dependent dehydrogenase (short-subunit alcohol dehydrogenase family)